jgi:hypothetical protein
MSTDRDMTRIVRSWLRTDEHESADGVLDNVFALLDTTPQRRRPLLPAWRIAEMNNYAKIGIAAAAVAVVAVIGYNLLPGTGPGGPTATPPVSPSPSPSAISNESPTPSVVFPPSGALDIARHTFTEDDLKFSLEISTAAWASKGYSADLLGGDITKGASGPEGAWVIMWSVDGAYTDPCGHVAGPAASTAADLAAAVAGIPGVEATAPSNVTVGGRSAKHVTITIPQDISCDPSAFYLWYNLPACGADNPCERWASAKDSTVRIWIVDMDKTHFWIEAETYLGASPELDQEIQAMIDSIQFE